MEPVEITDQESLEAWLNARPEASRQADGTAIATRAALRVFPLWSGAMDRKWARNAGLTSTPIMRQLLVSAVVSKYQGRDLRSAARPSSRASDYAAVVAAEAEATIDLGASDAAADAARAAADCVRAARHAAISAVDAGATAAAARVEEKKPSSKNRRYLAYEVEKLRMWTEISADATLIRDGRDPFFTPLWSSSPADWFTKMDQKARAIWAADPTLWSFWPRWWDGVLAGKPLDWELQKAVALIPDAVWKEGPGAVAAAIAGIEAQTTYSAPDFGPALADLPQTSPAQIKIVQTAMERNRAALPPTFDAIEGLILLEIERLQSKNDRDHEWTRQMQVYLALYDAICGLRANLPKEGPVSVQNAQESDGLIKLYLHKFSSLPREKADEIVQGVWDAGTGAVKVGLIGATSLLAIAYGLPVLAGVAIGSVVFASKNAAEIIKSAKEALPAPTP